MNAGVVTMVIGLILLGVFLWIVKREIKRKGIGGKK